MVQDGFSLVDMSCLTAAELGYDNLSCQSQQIANVGAQKKKCSETHPRCSRCVERDLDCHYTTSNDRPREAQRAKGVLREAAAPNISNQKCTLIISNSQSQPRTPLKDIEIAHADIDPKIPSNSNLCDGHPDFGENYSENRRAEMPALLNQERPIVQCSGSSGRYINTEEDEVPKLLGYPVESYIQQDTLVGHQLPSEDISISWTSDSLDSLYSQLPSPLLSFFAPSYLEFSDRPNRRALVDHFCRVLSHVMVFKEGDGNPFRQLLLPLAIDNSPVLDAIFALSSAHLEHQGKQCEETGLSFITKAIQGVSKMLQVDGDAHRDELLSTILLLIYYEVVSSRISLALGATC